MDTRNSVYVRIPYEIQSVCVLDGISAFYSYRIDKRQEEQRSDATYGGISVWRVSCIVSLSALQRYHE